MSGTTIRELVGSVWTIAYSDVPREDRRLRYRVLIEQIGAHCGGTLDDPDRSAGDGKFAAILRIVEELLRRESGTSA